MLLEGQLMASANISALGPCGAYLYIYIYIRQQISTYFLEYGTDNKRVPPPIKKRIIQYKYLRAFREHVRGPIDNIAPYCTG